MHLLSHSTLSLSLSYTPSLSLYHALSHTISLFLSLVNSHIHLLFHFTTLYLTRSLFFSPSSTLIYTFSFTLPLSISHDLSFSVSRQSVVWMLSSHSCRLIWLVYCLIFMVVVHSWWWALWVWDLRIPSQCMQPIQLFFMSLQRLMVLLAACFHKVSPAHRCKSLVYLLLVC